MKKLMLACLFICIQAGTIQAQQTNPNKNQEKQSGHFQPRNPEQRAARQTKLMVQSLNLTTEQEAKVQALNLKRMSDLENLRLKQNQDSVANQPRVGKEARNIRTNWNTGLKAILTPEQYAKYEAQQSEMKVRRSEMGKKRNSDLNK